MTTRRPTVLVLGLMVALLTLATPAHAAFPGQNGKIAWTTSTAEIFTINPDGTGQANITNNLSETDGAAAWSADGQKLAFNSCRSGACGIWVADANGAGATRVIANSGINTVSFPAWSPDGRKLAFSRRELGSECSPQADLFVANADGTGITRLTDDLNVNNTPGEWSPDGQKIVFTSTVFSDDCDIYETYPGEIETINVDGSGRLNISNSPASYDGGPGWSPDGTKIAFSGDSPSSAHQVRVVSAAGGSSTALTSSTTSSVSPAWSPDGKKIAFTSERVGDNGAELYVMNSDGTGQARLTSVHGHDSSPAWQPILHDIPQSADTLHMSLVPMFRQTISSSQCAARGGQTSTHGAPLAFSSCNPPGYLPNTMARLGPSSSSSVDVTGVPGDPVTSADEADLTFNVSANDVRALPGGGDYDPSASPDATLSLIVRWSDTYNGPALRAPATGSDLTYSVPVSCAATASSSVGSNCSTNTTADALAPGTILEGRRTVITLSRWWLYDSGLNTTRGDGDDRMFAHSGIYVP